MRRRILYFCFLLVVAWQVMTFTHEMGHVIGGWCSGGTLKAAKLLPWQFPYSSFDPDPSPLITLWCGPILGVVVPLIPALLFRRRSTWFVASFCLLANGSYLALGWISGDRYLDTTKLLAAGSHPVTIVAFCLLTIGFGYVRFRQSCIAVLEPSSGEKKFPQNDVSLRSNRGKIGESKDSS